MTDTPRSPKFDSGLVGGDEATTPPANTAFDSGKALRVSARPKSGAERVRLWRQRRKAQLRILQVEVDLCDLEDYFLASGELDRSKLDDQAELSAALTQVVKRLIRSPGA